MIQIENLVKRYGKSTDALVALDHVSLTLPDTGLVFVLGKSGCGKSTLLNMLGGLDDITEGEIFYDDVAISKLGETELNIYRNNCIGIIYQNFNLFEKETVFDNIYLAGKKSEKALLGKKIDGLLADLTLSEKKNSLIKNLSGGQKQRVAIARALIKDSKVILADEPTGNLDSKNTKMIFDILKKTARDRLVVVVSHDVKSAEAYADRIISLSDGKVVDDVVRNAAFEETDNAVFDLPADCSLTEKEIKEINVKLKKGKLELRKNERRFSPTPKMPSSPSRTAEFKTREKNVITPFGISYRYLKGTYLSFIFSVVLLSVIIALLAFSNSFMRFDSSDSIRVINETYNAKAYVLKKAFSYYDDPLDVSKGAIYEIKDTDAESFKKNGYTGDIYPIYDLSLGNEEMDFYQQSNNRLYRNFYSSGGLGVTVVTKEYLEKTFGDLELLAGSFYGLDKSDAIVVTDYFADSLLKKDQFSLNGELVSEDPNDPYQKIVNQTIGARYRIGAVVKTDYKEKYAELITLHEQLLEDGLHEREIRREIYQHPLINHFLMEVNTTLNLGYSLNPDFKECVLDLPEQYSFAVVPTFNVNDKSDNFFAQGKYPVFMASPDDALSKGEMTMALVAYNEIFSKSVTTDKAGFEEKEIILKFHKFDETAGTEAFLSIPMKVVDVYDNTKGDNSLLGYFNDEDFKAIKSIYLYPYALLFDDPYQCYALNAAATDLYYYSDLSVYSPVFTVHQIIDVFSEIFKFIFIALIVIATIILVLHNLRVIRNSRYLIGVYKSLGYPGSSFSVASVLSGIYLNGAIFAFATILSYFSTKFINGVLTKSFAYFFKEPLMTQMTLVGFSFPLVAVYVAIVFGVSIVTLLSSFVAIRRLKPNNILHKAVE